MAIFLFLFTLPRYQQGTTIAIDDQEQESNQNKKNKFQHLLRYTAGFRGFFLHFDKFRDVTETLH